MAEPKESPALSVLVVDDERLSRVATVRQLKDCGFTAAAVENGFAALDHLAREACDVVLCDLRMPGMDGLDLLRTIRRDHPHVEVILMTAYGTIETAVEAMQHGAIDYITKPFHVRQLEHRLLKLAELARYRGEVTRLRAILGEGPDASGLLGQSAGIVEVRRRIQAYGPHTAPVLIWGETGTGKELVSRALHEASPRARNAFVAVPCGAIPATLAESELFGHERGAFTGASAQHIGAFERARNGTLLLDDVDDLPLPIQVKLLRVLQDGTFVRVGGNHEVQVDVRVLATTKARLQDEVAAARFRDDLYYRLRGLEIHLPPLRERGEDLMLLAHHFLMRAANRNGRDLTLGLEAAAALRRHSWPGNVRELRHAMESIAVLAGDGPVGLEHLPDFLRGPPAGAASPYYTLHLEGQDAVPFAEVVRAIEDEFVQWALRKAGGQQARAAELLALARTTFQSKLARPS